VRHGSLFLNGVDMNGLLDPRSRRMAAWIRWNALRSVDVNVQLLLAAFST